MIKITCKYKLDPKISLCKSVICDKIWPFDWHLFADILHDSASAVIDSES